MQNFMHYLIRNGLSPKEYQQKGIQWCTNIEKAGVLINDTKIHSGILADEMGLGKTIQMIGLILENFKLHNLIVLPKALLQQWQHIFYTTLGHNPLVYHGASAKHITMHQLYNAPIVLTTYGMLLQMKGKYNILHNMTWERIIFDEAHHLRNRNTRNHKAALHIQAKHKWLVTGTPIQNSLTDMYGLCALLGIEQTFYTKREHIDIIINSLILKRTKSQVGIEMPTLTHNTITVQWENNTEKQIAQTLHSLHFRNTDTTLQQDMPLHPFTLMQRAQQSCITMKMLKNTDLKYQSKINYVVNMIKERKDNGSAKLVFCFYHTEMDIIVQSLGDIGMRVAKLDGRTNQTNRKLLLSSNLDVLVLQIKTGCEGLNLQQFSEVYFVSPQWNPAMEDQAVARSHRIGQVKPVHVFNFNMEWFEEDMTMDSYITGVQHYKRGLYLP